ncbi:aplysianin-A-like [Liolophura sinensis]|uniref:aplysianin-A-like n=1 Tax=Liolophura sinensis TaxID=3198878 RepID=UPI003158BB11
MASGGEGECLDVAIVGGGIGGTYTAWRLRERGLKIAIFENTDRIGGRTFSVFLPSVPNVPADLGAMRFHRGIHTTLEGLLPQLGLRSEVFQPDQFQKMFHFRGRRLTGEELNSTKLPYNLSPSESKITSNLIWRLSQQALNVSRPDQIPDIEEATTPDGVPVYKQSYLNLMDKLWSSEAKNYLKDLSVFYTLFDTNVNAVHDAVATNPLVPSPQFTLFNTSLLFQIRPRRICASQVILALPPGALKNIQWGPLQNALPVKTALESVNDFSAMKIFLAYPSAWWDNFSVNYKAFFTDLPLRQGGEFGRFRNSSGHETALMMVSYADTKENNDFWRHLRSSPNTISSFIVPAAFSVSTKVVEHVHHHLATMYDVNASSIPMPIDGVMHIWDDPQNGGAWQLFKPGYQPKAVANFIQQPSASDDVFIVTNAFSRDLYGWSEGCLRAADKVLRQFFNMI